MTKEIDSNDNLAIVKDFKMFPEGGYAYETSREIKSEEDMWQLLKELEEEREKNNLNTPTPHIGMHKIKCKLCKKEIEGYTKSHAEYLLSQHMIKHRDKKEVKK